MDETDPFLNTNPFAALGDIIDGEQLSPTNAPTPNPTPGQQPLTANELELEAIRAQQRALLQGFSSDQADAFNNTSATMSVASPAPYVTDNNTGFAQQSEEKEEPPPEQQREDQAFADGQQSSTDFDRDAGPTAGAVPINQDLQLLLQAIQAQHRQLQ